MRRFFLTYSLLIFLIVPSIAQTGYATTTTQTHMIYAADLENLQLEMLPINVEIKTTNSKRIIIEQKISTNISNENLLHYLIKQGRYDLKKNVDHTSSTVSIQAPDLSNALIIKGEQIEEVFQYTIYIPEHIHTQLSNQATAHNSLN